VAEEISPLLKAPEDPQIEALKRKLKLELDRAEPPWLGYSETPGRH